MQSIRRGTTPTVTCNLSFTQQEIEALYVTFWQNGEPIFTKGLEDVTWEESGISFRLSQEDTLKFSENDTAQAQMRLKLVGGLALGSNKVAFTITGILKEGVI